MQHHISTSTGTSIGVKNSLLALLSSGLFAVWSAAQVRLFDYLLFERRNDYEFVLTSIAGVLAGTPVSKSWQQRILGPAAVAALGDVVSSDVGSNRLLALRIVSAILLFAANALVFALMRRKGHGLAQCLGAVVALGLAHLLLLYRLEYPWDGLDVLLFLGFGYWAQRGGSLVAVGPLMFAGAFNHETVLYVPLWYALSLFQRDARARREAGGAVVAGVLLVLLIAGLRQALYVGKPDLPGQVFEVTTPFIANHLHVAYNVQRFLHADFRAGGTWFTAALLSGLVGLFAWAVQRGLVRAAVWSALVVLSVFCFGYLNETRHYLSLLAFWFGYGLRGHGGQRFVS